MKNTYIHLALILAASTVNAPAWAQTVTISASKDNTIYQNNVNRSAGGAAGIFSGTVGVNGAGTLRRGLIAFNVAAIVPAGSVITSAQLTLTLGAAGGGASQSIELHRLNVDWGEGTAGSSDPIIAHAGVGFNAAAGDATWSSNFLGSSLWSNPGATGDYSATASATTVVPSIIEAQYTWLSNAAIISDVQSWLDNPATNFGWALINADEVNVATVRAFYSRSAASDAGGDPLDPIARPALSVTYSVPEPSAAVLLLWSIAWPFFGRRR